MQLNWVPNKWDRDVILIIAYIAEFQSHYARYQSLDSSSEKIVIEG